MLLSLLSRDNFVPHLFFLKADRQVHRYGDFALAKLPREHRRLFIDAVRGHLIPALAAGAHHGAWPRRLRVHKIGEVYSLTWSFAGPDGRALFTIGPDTDGEPLLTWLAIGYHDICQ